MQRSFFPLILFGLCCALTSCRDRSTGQTPVPPSPVHVQVVTAGTRELPQTLSAVGSLQSPGATTVAAEIAGRVVFLDIPEGQQVDQGHLLARIDDKEARATLKIAEARFRNADDRMKRTSALRKSGVTSQQELDDARTELDAARGQLADAQAAIAKTEVRAPFSGTVGLRQVNLGEYVPAGQAIVQITRADVMELVFSVPQKSAERIQVGQRLHGTVGRSDHRFEGEVSAKETHVDLATRMLRVRGTVNDPDATLLPGMAVHVRVNVGLFSEAIVVPQEAIVRQGTKYIVYVLDEQERAHQREVKLGEYFVDGVHVTEGVRFGERVVVAGHQKLRPGSQTVPAPFEPTENPNLQLGAASF